MLNGRVLGRLAALVLITLALSGPAFGQVTFTVNTGEDGAFSGDSNPGDGVCEDQRAGSRCTLRAAIEEANASGTNKVIKFLVPFDITLSAPLPVINVPLFIDGRSALGYNASATDISAAQPKVFIDGSGLGGTPSADGLRIRSASKVYGIGIINFPDNGIDIDIDTFSISYLDSNWIGVNKDGNPAGNGTGILVGGRNTRIGERFSLDGNSLGNVISSNDDFGVQILAGEGVQVLRNRIGTAPNGTTARPNGAGGVDVVGPNNIIGARLKGNLIRSNSGPGVRLIGGGNSIRANVVTGNTGIGIRVDGTGNTVGFPEEEQKNEVIQNGGPGILLGSVTGASSATVRGNEVLNNGGIGIHLQAGNNGVISSNIVGGNAGDGIRVTANDASISNNQVGFSNPVAPTDRPNFGNGILIDGNRASIRLNQIGNTPNGVSEGIDVIAGDSILLEDNWIGLTNQLQPLPNAGDGIRLRSAVTNARVDDNVIGFSRDGMRIEASGADICGNHVGVSPPPQLIDIGNNVEGLRLLGNQNEVGRATAGCIGNYFGNNGSDGIQAEGDDNDIYRNFLGGTGDDAFGNSQGGLLLTAGAAGNRVGGNVIRSNGDSGIRVGSTAGQGNDLRGNEYFQNGSGLGVDLNTDGPTANDAGDDDEGPNRTMNTIEVISSVSETDRVNLEFRIDADNTNATYPLSVDFYTVSAPGQAQGREFINGALYDQAPGTAKTVEVFVNPSLMRQITAMVTDANGNSSEFSTPYLPPPPPALIFSDGFED